MPTRIRLDLLVTLPEKKSVDKLHSLVYLIADLSIGL